MNSSSEDRNASTSDLVDEQEHRAAGPPEKLATGWEQFAPLYNQNHVRLYRFALLLCNGNRAAAEDAVAETFIMVYPAWSTGRVDNFFGYARTALVNHILGQYRRDSVMRRYVASRRGDQRGESRSDDETVDQSAMFGYLQQLPPRQRAAVVLRFYEDLTYEQIAATLDVSVGTAKSNVSIGLQRLRELIERPR